MWLFLNRFLLLGVFLNALLVCAISDANCVFTDSSVEGYYLPYLKHHRGRVNVADNRANYQTCTSGLAHGCAITIFDQLGIFEKDIYCCNSCVFEGPEYFVLNLSENFQFSDVGLFFNWTQRGRVSRFETELAVPQRVTCRAKFACLSRFRTFNYTLNDVASGAAALSIMHLQPTAAVEVATTIREFTTVFLSLGGTGIEMEMAMECWGSESGDFFLSRRKHICENVGSKFLEKNYIKSFLLLPSFAFDIFGEYSISNKIYDILYGGLSHSISKTLALLKPAICLKTALYLTSPADFLNTVVGAMPRTFYPCVFYFINTAPWRRVAFGAAAHALQLAKVLFFMSTALVLSANKGIVVSATGLSDDFQHKALEQPSYQWNVSSVNGNVNKVVLFVNGSFFADSRVELHVYKQKGDQTDSYLSSLKADDHLFHAASAEKSIYTSLARVVGALAVAVHPIFLDESEDEAPFSVVVTIDDVSFSAKPLTLALSPLAVSMRPSKICPSGWQFHDKCVCVGKVNHTAHLCGEMPPAFNKRVSYTVRLVFVLTYFFLLIACASCIWLFIARGEAKILKQKERIERGDIIAEQNVELVG